MRRYVAARQVSRGAKGNGQNKYEEEWVGRKDPRRCCGKAAAGVITEGSKIKVSRRFIERHARASWQRTVGVGNAYAPYRHGQALTGISAATETENREGLNK